MSKTKSFQFAMRHSALHFAKTAGKIAAVSEKADHGEKFDYTELKMNISKSLINVLRLAAFLEMSEDDLIKSIENIYSNKTK